MKGKLERCSLREHARNLFVRDNYVLYRVLLPLEVAKVVVAVRGQEDLCDVIVQHGARKMGVR